jgi:hypothetical protein
MTIELGNDLTLAVSSAREYEALGKLIWAERWNEALERSHELIARGSKELDRALTAAPRAAMPFFEQAWRIRAGSAALIAVLGWRGREVAEFNQSVATGASVQSDSLRRNIAAAERRRRAGFEGIHIALRGGDRDATLAACRELRETATAMLTWAPAVQAGLHAQLTSEDPDNVQEVANTFLALSQGARESLMALAAASLFSLDAMTDKRLAHERRIAERRPFVKNIRNWRDRTVAAARRALERRSPLFEVAGVVTKLKFDRGAIPLRTTFTLEDVVDRSQKVAIRAKHFRLKSLGVCEGTFVRVGVRCKDIGFLDVERIPLSDLAELSWFTYAIRKAEALYDLYPESLAVQFTASPERKEGGGRNSRLRGASEFLEQPPMFRKLFDVGAA